MHTRQLLQQDDVVGPYKLLNHLGQGGMGIVYKALDTRLDRYVALKFLINAPENDAAAKQRFITEARAASALDHPNICTIYDIGEAENNQFYIAMAFYEGEMLDKKISENPLSLLESLSIITQVAKGLGVAHAYKIIHRDIKPSNIILKDNQAKILDFGIAKIESGEANTLTKTGISLGTISYSSPEQLQGHRVDKQTDIWSLGVMFYEMLSGSPPFQENSPYGVMYNILHQAPQPLNSKIPGIPQCVDDILARMLKRERGERYQSIEDVLADLSRLNFELDADSEQTQIFIQNELNANESNSNPVDSPDKVSVGKSRSLFVALVAILTLSGLMLFFWNFSDKITEHSEKAIIIKNEPTSPISSEQIAVFTPDNDSKFGDKTLVSEISVESSSPIKKNVRELQEDPIPLPKDKLFHAAKSGNINLVRQFLSQNKININVVDEMKWTALAHACWQGHPEIVSLLLEAGADPAVNQHQALIVSVVKGQLGIVRTLLKFNADPNARDESTVPVLMLALVSSSPHRTDMVDDLLLAGADPYGAALGKTAIDLAREMGLSAELEKLQR